MNIIIFGLYIFLIGAFCGIFIYKWYKSHEYSKRVKNGIRDAKERKRERIIYILGTIIIIILLFLWIIFS